MKYFIIFLFCNISLFHILVSFLHMLHFHLSNFFTSVFFWCLLVFYFMFFLSIMFFVFVFVLTRLLFVSFVHIYFIMGYFIYFYLRLSILFLINVPIVLVCCYMYIMDTKSSWSIVMLALFSFSFFHPDEVLFLKTKCLIKSLSSFYPINAAN